LRYFSFKGIIVTGLSSCTHQNTLPVYLTTFEDTTAPTPLASGGMTVPMGDASYIPTPFVSGARTVPSSAGGDLTSNLPTPFVSGAGNVPSSAGGILHAHIILFSSPTSYSAGGCAMFALPDDCFLTMDKWFFLYNWCTMCFIFAHVMLP
jgi:hypothetical protein